MFKLSANQKQELRRQADGFELVLSMSGGKDSLATLHLLLEAGVEPAGIFFYDGGWEMPYIREHLAVIEEKTGCKINIIESENNFDYCIRVRGYGWPRFGQRWCTGLKVKGLNACLNAFDKPKNVVGIAYDERQRVYNGNLLTNKVPPMFPMVVCKMTTKEALQWCYDLGYDFCGHYKLFNRLNCYCCPLSREASWKILYKEFPTLWRNMLEYQFIMGTYVYFVNELTVLDLHKRFVFEEECERIRIKPRYIYANANCN